MNYWKRHISFRIGTHLFSSPFYMKFNSSFSMKGNSNTYAYLYNPSGETIASVENHGNVYQKIQIDAGYEKDHGVCVIGEIYKSKVTKNGMDRVLEMQISDSAKNWSQLRVSKTWPKDVKASTVINDLANEFLMPIGVIEPGIDKSFAAGVSFNMKLKSAMEYMARETDSSFFIRAGRIYFQSKKSEGIKTGVFLSPATGLIEKPEKCGNGWKIKSLFNYRIGSGEYISVMSDSFTGDCKVIKGTHSYSDENAFTEMEVQLI